MFALFIYSIIPSFIHSFNIFEKLSKNIFHGKGKNRIKIGLQVCFEAEFVSNFLVQQILLVKIFLGWGC